MGAAGTEPQLQTRRIETSAGLVHVASAGEGDPVLLLHGIGSSADSFRAQFAGLADGYRVLAWDAPGYARSDDPPGEVTVDGYVRAAADVLDAFGIDTVHLAGVSWGGFLATRIALDRHDRVATLALIGATPGRRGTPTVDDLEARCRLLEERGPEGFAHGRAVRVLAPGADPRLVADVERNMAASIRPAGYRSAAASLAGIRHGDELATITAPTLVVVGEQDVITGPAESRVLADGIPGAELVSVDGAGHLVNQERPDVVNAVLRKHWSRRRGATS